MTGSPCGFVPASAASALLWFQRFWEQSEEPDGKTGCESESVGFKSLLLSRQFPQSRCNEAAAPVWEPRARLTSAEPGRTDRRVRTSERSEPAGLHRKLHQRKLWALGGAGGAGGGGGLLSCFWRCESWRNQRNQAGHGDAGRGQSSETAVRRLQTPETVGKSRLAGFCYSKKEEFLLNDADLQQSHFGFVEF